MKQLELYQKYLGEFLKSSIIKKDIEKSVELVRAHKRIFFIGNGGSSSICSHMMEDYMKIGGKQTLSFTDAALITCFANDYGWENAMSKWIEFNFMPEDLLVAISSSGESKNIINAVNVAKEKGGKVITLTGFRRENCLGNLGDENIITPIRNYGIVESIHSILLHIILDELQES